ncbi:MAG: DUF3100 domain-containing protein [Methanobrevibacter sp.]|nr:DUF3100 domain-containing protein [Methanobrevibacter sp.]MDO5848925.1 DUF3100 domain-containing protein [Methanobrevibacter sp.]
MLKKKPWKSYKLHLTVLALVIIAELIGPIKVPITSNIELSAMPLLWAMLGGLFLYLFKPAKFITRKQARIAEGAMLLFIGPLLCKLAISSGQSIDVLFKVGPALILQEAGNLGTIFLALPIALVLGFKREAIGMTNSIGREPNVAVVIDKFGFDSPETRGVLTVFLIGTVIGTLYISFLSSFCVSVLPFHPYAFAMGSGVGSASMNAAALAPLLAMFPDISTNIEAFSGFSNLISFCIGIYVCIFIAIPLTQKLYEILEPKIGRNPKDSQKEGE